MAEKQEKQQLNPQGIQASSKADYIRRGWLYYNQKNFYEAKADFNKALELEPDDINTLYALGLSLKAMGEKEEAKAMFNQVIEKSKGSERTDLSQIIRSLALGQYNQIEKGTW